MQQARENEELWAAQGWIQDKYELGVGGNFPALTHSGAFSDQLHHRNRPVLVTCALCEAEENALYHVNPALMATSPQ